VVAAAVARLEDGKQTVTRASHHHLAKHVDEHRLRAAIRAAESGTTGKIHLTLSHPGKQSTLAAAQHAFSHQRFANTQDRNGVLIFVIPERREFAVFGDAGIHDKAGQDFWERVAAAMSEKMRSAGLTEGLIHGIDETGKELRRHFPDPG
ncbi:MAG: TPM domain-containing protein, partial [Candidatus Eremiobacteraeota bacterium]|nr:TPM domain-containing protein [Candidatus Eremiobacteraeota bacterium]